MASPAAVVGVAQQGVDTALKALDIYNRLVKNVIPWEVFEDTIKHLNEAKQYYSDEAGEIIGDVAKLLLDCQDAYLSSQDDVYEWCSVASPLLRAFMVKFPQIGDENTAKVQKALLVKVLDEGTDRISKAKANLEQARSSFNEAYGALVSLEIQFDNDFDENSSYFSSQVSKLRIKAYASAGAGYLLGPLGLITAQAIAAAIVEGKLIPEMKKALEETRKKFDGIEEMCNKARNDILSAKQQLTDEITVLTAISAQITVTRQFADIWVLAPNAAFDDLKVATNRLILLADAYVKGVNKQRRAAVE